MARVALGSDREQREAAMIVPISALVFAAVVGLIALVARLRRLEVARRRGFDPNGQLPPVAWGPEGQPNDARAWSAGLDRPSELGEDEDRHGWDGSGESTGRTSMDAGLGLTQGQAREVERSAAVLRRVRGTGRGCSCRSGPAKPGVPKDAHHR